MKIRTNIPIIILAILLGGIAAGCSTTAKLASGEMLYTGMKLDLKTESGEKLPSDMVSNLVNAVNVRPNNPWPLLTPYVRTPFPFGLWVYNNIPDSATGIKGWIYRKFAEPPVLVSDIHPEVRIKAMQGILKDNGYFNSRGRFQIDTTRNGRKGKIVYTMDVPQPHILDSIEYINDHTPLGDMVDSLSRLSKYLVKGERFCVDSLVAERVRVANQLRNRGYYYFRPEYIEYLADSLIYRNGIVLRVALAENIPSLSRLQRAFKRAVELTVYHQVQTCIAGHGIGRHRKQLNAFEHTEAGETVLSAIHIPNGE